LGVPAIALGLILVPLTIDRPDILVAPDGSAVAVRDRSGTLRISGTRAGSYAVQQFFDEEGGPPADAAALREGTQCDAAACLLSGSQGDTVSHVLDPLAFSEDCARSAIIVTKLAAPTGCAAPLVIDAPQLARFGAHAIWIDRTDETPRFRIATDRSATPRPWQAGAAPFP
jgi:competence protein ComEC